MHTVWQTAVRAVAFSSDGSLLASCAEDGTVFFFRVTSPYPTLAVEPLAFMAGPPGITAATWTPGERKLTLGFRNGTITEVRQQALVAVCLPVVTFRTHPHQLTYPARAATVVVLYHRHATRTL